MPTNAPTAFVRPPQLTTRVSYATVAGPGRTIFTAGGCPLDPDGKTVGKGEVAAQAEQVMANLVTTLHGTGAELSDAVKTTVYDASSEQADLVAAWTDVRGAFGGPFAGFRFRGLLH